MVRVIKPLKKIALFVVAGMLIALFAEFCPIGSAFADSASIGSAAGQSEKFSMSYVYFGYPAVYTAYIDRTNGSLDDISPSYFDLNEDGTLKLTMAVDRSFVENMHKRGIKVTPFLSNHWNRQVGIKALENRNRLSEQVAEAIERYNLDGVNIDIENVTEKERELYTDFVRLVREKVADEKSVSVAVAANPWNLETGWHGSYDYAELARYCDYLMLMAYDQHYEGSKPGPVAGYSFVEESIKEALKYVPENKLVLGIPFYGRLWKQGASYGGYGISNYYVEELIKKYRGISVYDNETRSAKATITILKGDVKPVVFGHKLDEGKYDIWYENEDSIKSKLALVRKYNLKGAGSWSLGQESVSTWEYYSLWLNGSYFSDILNNWAKDYILQVVDRGWMIGMAGSKFMPALSLTRAQAAVILVRALGIDTSAEVNAPLVFTDTNKHWARTEIEAARQNGLVEGIGAGKYGPDEKLTREQMALLIYRILNTEKQGEQVYFDVTPETCPWSYYAINSISALGIVDGYPDGGFHPKDPLSRAEMAAIMIRLEPYL